MWSQIDLDIALGGVDTGAQQFSRLAVDVSSFYRDISEDEAFRILQQAVEGNTRGLRQLGITIRDADLILVDLRTSYTLKESNLFQRHRVSPYVGRTFTGVVRQTLLGKLATDRQRVIGFHLPFPGIGLVERNGSSYRFVPA